MENAEEIYQSLEEFSKRKPKSIPRELDDYLTYVARTGDPIYQWPLIKSLFKEKLLTVITDFYETSPGIDIPHCPNVDPFNYDVMKNSLLERIETFTSAPFTVQRICELLTAPRKHYHRIDKFMRAVEKNVLVVSTREPGIQRHYEAENGDSMVNGSDNTSDYNVDVEMQDASWKENSLNQSQPQSSTSDGNVNVEDIDVAVTNKEDIPVEQNIITPQYESVTPPDVNASPDDSHSSSSEESDSFIEKPLDLEKPEDNMVEASKEQAETDPDKKTISHESIPEIKVEDADMVDQKLASATPLNNSDSKETPNIEDCKELESSNSSFNDSPIVTMVTKSVEKDSSLENLESQKSKPIADILMSEESSSSNSSEYLDTLSNSPKHYLPSNMTEDTKPINENENSPNVSSIETVKTDEIENQQSDMLLDNEASPATLGKPENDDYSIADVKSELAQPSESKLTPTVIVANELSTITEPISQDSEIIDHEEQKAEESPVNETETKPEQSGE